MAYLKPDLKQKLFDAVIKTLICQLFRLKKSELVCAFISQTRVQCQ
jgi:hypothetical protein